MSEADAVKLFNIVVSRDVEPDDAVEVVRLCGGLPLAIRFAAVQTRTTTVDEVLRELRDLDGVVDEVNAAFALSYRRLPEDARRLFRYLGMNPCLDFTEATTAALADVTEEVAVALIAMMVEHSLLEERSPGRFAHHDLVRSYARALSRVDDPEPEIRKAIRRLADHYAKEAERASEALRSRESAPHVGAAPKNVAAREGGDAEHAWLRAEYENILRLAEYCGRHERKRHCIRLVRAVSDFLGTNGHWEQCRHAHELVRKACRDTDDIHGTADASDALSLVCLRTGRLDDSYAYASEAKTLFGRTGDRRGWAEATDRLGVVSRHQARFRAALAHHEEAIHVSRSAGDPVGAAQAMFHAATALHMLGRLTEEMAYLAEALGVFRQRGDLRSQGLVHNSIGLIHLDRGFHRHATASFQSSNEIFRAIGGRQNLAVLDHNMGKVHQYRGGRNEALTMYRSALAEFRSMGDLRNEALVRADIGSVLCESQSYPAAVAEYDRALAIAELMGDKYTHVLALCGIADTRRESDALDLALTFYERAERLAAQIEAQYPRGRALHGIAEVMARRRDEDAARIHWREALDVYQGLGSYLAGIVAMRLEPFSNAA
jgi:tetratricopeptide (TPR) repeat protein